MKNIASYLHLSLCKKSHLSNIEDLKDESFNSSKNCKWYLEEQFDSCWEESEHVFWLKKAEVLQKVSDLSEEDLNKMFNHLITVTRDVNKLVKQHELLKEFILDFIKASIS